MRKPSALASFALLTLLGLATEASAVGITVQPVIRSLQNLDLSPVAPSSITLLDSENFIGVAEGTPSMIVTVDYYMTIANLSGAPFELGFGNLAMNLLPTHLGIAQDTTGWNPDTSVVDINGELEGGEAAIWADNGDLGPSATDLVSIVVGLAPSGFGAEGVDPRRTLGQQTPTLLGTTYFQWDPSTETASELEVDVDAFSTYGADLRLRRRAAGTRTGGSLSMFVSAGQAGDTDKDGDVDLDDLNNVRNHFDETGENIVGDTAPFDGVVDLDDLNRVRDNFGAVLSIPNGFTAVPEPGSLALAIGSAAAFGLCVRRRFGA